MGSNLNYSRQTLRNKVGIAETGGPRVLGSGTREWMPPPPNIERRPPQLPPMRNIKGDLAPEIAEFRGE